MQRNKAYDAQRTNIPPRTATEDEIEAMGALITVAQAATITGETQSNVAKCCASGTYPARKCGRKWLINKAKFLELVGLA